MICNEPDVLDGFLTSTVGSIHRNKSTPGFMSSFLPGFYSGRRNGSKKTELDGMWALPNSSADSFVEAMEIELLAPAAVGGS